MKELPDITGKMVTAIQRHFSADGLRVVNLVIEFTDNTRLEVTSTHFVAGLVVDMRK